jgi:hypothetical protein
LATALLGITFPFLIFFAEFLQDVAASEVQVK